MARERPAQRRRLNLSAEAPQLCLPNVSRGTTEAARAELLQDSSKWLDSRLLWPVGSKAFFEQSFRKQPMHLPAASTRLDELKSAMGDLDPEFLLHNTASEAVHVWIKQQDGGLGSITVEEAGAAVTLYNAGHSTYCRAPADVEGPLVTATLAALGGGFGLAHPTGNGAKGEVEMFLSRKGHATGWHFDFQENFTVQLAGTKVWRLKPSGVKHPLRGCTPHFTDHSVVEQQLQAAWLAKADFEWGAGDDGEDAVVFTVSEGDVLYHPAGWWHCVDTTEDSISINVSLILPTWADFVCGQLRNLLLQSDAFREGVALHALAGVNGSTSVVQGSKAARAHLQNLLQMITKGMAGSERLLANIMLPVSFATGMIGGLETEEEEFDLPPQVTVDLFPRSENAPESASRVTRDEKKGASWRVNPLVSLARLDQLGATDVAHDSEETVDGNDSEVELENLPGDGEGDHIEYVVNFSPTEEFIPRSRVRLRLPKPPEEHDVEQLLVEMMDNLVEACRARSGEQRLSLGYQQKVALVESPLSSNREKEARAHALCNAASQHRLFEDASAFKHVREMMRCLCRYGVLEPEGDIPWLESPKDDISEG